MPAGVLVAAGVRVLIHPVTLLLETIRCQQVALRALAQGRPDVAGVDIGSPTVPSPNCRLVANTISSPPADSSSAHAISPPSRMRRSPRQATREAATGCSGLQSNSVDGSGPQSGSIPVELQSRRPRRADAERNRVRVLDAARRLVAERGIAAVTMDDIAAAAGVGKGTVYRAVDNRGGLAEALLDAAERDLQEAVLSGDPPLGPGGRPAERLHAFAERYLGFLDANVALLIEADHHTPGGRFATGAHAFWHTHITALTRQLGCARPDLTAELILAVLAADLHDHIRRNIKRRPAHVRDDILNAIDSLVTGIC